MEQLHWELSVLSRAVAYANLSGAAANIGLSQPQLSRIVARIEGELGIILLDRASRRKSGWTPAAFQLAEVYSKNIRNLSKEIQKLTESRHPKQLKIGILEGLIPVASAFCKHLFEIGVKLVEVDVHDLNELEELFFRGAFDMIFISREPGRKKFRFSKLLGYQSMERPSGARDTAVMSSFEYATRATGGRGADSKRVLISNSLALRKSWVRLHGGEATIPSELLREKPAGRNVEHVHLIASDLMGPAFWESVSAFSP